MANATLPNGFQSRGCEIYLVISAKPAFTTTNYSNQTATRQIAGTKTQTGAPTSTSFYQSSTSTAAPTTTYNSTTNSTTYSGECIPTEWNWMKRSGVCKRQIMEMNLSFWSEQQTRKGLKKKKNHNALSMRFQPVSVWTLLGWLGFLRFLNTVWFSGCPKALEICNLHAFQFLTQRSLNVGV